MIWSNPVMNLRHAAYHSATNPTLKNDEDLYAAALRYAEAEGYVKPTPRHSCEIVDCHQKKYVWQCRDCKARIIGTDSAHEPPNHNCHEPHWTAPPYRTEDLTLAGLPKEPPPQALNIRVSLGPGRGHPAYSKTYCLQCNRPRNNFDPHECFIEQPCGRIY